MQTRPFCFLIDNDEDDREIFGMALQEADPEVDCHSAASGMEALPQLKDNSHPLPFCIFVDMNMPMMNGIECLRELRQIPHLIAVPIYMYSTSADPVSVKEVKQLGAAGFIVKPSGFADLTDMLSKLMQQHKAIS